MSISSFDPAARMFGWFASTAKAGSFCLFCENGVGGLPTLTREAFQDYWYGTHGPLVASVAETLQIRRYVQLHSLPPAASEGLREARRNFPAMEEVAHDAVGHRPVVAVDAVVMRAEPRVARELQSARSTQTHASSR